MASNNRTELIDMLSKQCDAAHTRWKEDGIKTIIIIDGLDHVLREQTPERSFMCDLPNPEQIKPGVLFVLSSQQMGIDKLCSAIKLHLQKENRTLLINRIQKSSLFEWLETMHMGFSLNQKERIYELTSGHPLAINLLLQRVKSQINSMEIDKILNDIILHKEDESIETQFEAIWEKTNDLHSGMCDLLGVVSRLKDGFDEMVLEELANNDERLLQVFWRAWGHMFVDDGLKIRPFHNSILQYLSSKSATNYRNKYSNDYNIKYYSKIALCLEQLPDSSSWSWELPYYYYKADNPKILEYINIERIRKQLNEFRPFQSIINDLHLAMLYAKKKSDVLALIRIAIFKAEISSRDYFHNEYDFELTGLLVKCLRFKHDEKFLHQIITRIRNGTTLLMGPEKAMLLAQDILQRQGSDADGNIYHNEAKKIFDLSEPWHELRHHRPDTHEKKAHLYRRIHNWAYVAPYYKTPEDIIAIIVSLKNAPYFTAIIDPFGGQDDNISDDNISNDEILLKEYEDFCFHLYNEAACSYLEQRDHMSFRKILNAAHRINSQFSTAILINSLLHYSDIIEAHDIRMYMDEVMAKIKDIDVVDEFDRIRVAILTIRILKNHEKAKELIEGIDYRKTVCSKSFNDYLDIFYLAWVQYALGDRPEPEKVIKDVDKPAYQPCVIFERAIVKIAQINASAWLGDTLTPAYFLREIKPYLRIFEEIGKLPINESHVWNEYVSCHQVQYIRLVFQTASKFGNTFVEEVATHIMQRLSSSDEIWSFSAIIETISILHEFDCPESVWKEWSSSFIKSIPDQLNKCDTDERLSLLYKTANALAVLGEQEMAISYARKAYTTSASIGYRKDYQMNDWIARFGDLNHISPSNSFNRIQFLLDCIKSLTLTIESRPVASASKCLLNITYLHNSRLAVQVLNDLARSGAIGWVDGLSFILEKAFHNDAIDIEVLCSIFANMVMPSCSFPDEKLCQLILDKSDNKCVLNMARYSQIVTPEESRNTWKTIIKKSQKTYLLSSKVCDEIENDTCRNSKMPDEFLKIKLSSGKTLSEEEFLESFTNVEEFLLLANQIDNQSYYPRLEVLKPWIESLHVDEIECLYDGLNSEKGCFFEIKTRCLKKMFVLSKSKINFEKLKQLFYKKYSYDSFTWWTGPKKVLVDMMIEIDRISTVPILIEEFAKYLQSDFFGISAIVQYFDIISNAISDNDQMLIELEKDIYEYLSACCFQNKKLSGTSLGTQEVFDSNEFLFDIIEYSICYPASLVSTNAYKALNKIVLKKPALVKRYLQVWLSQNEELAHACLTILLAASPPSEYMESFSFEIKKLSCSNNYVLRMLSRKINRIYNLFDNVVPNTDSSILNRYNSGALYAPYVKLDETPIVPLSEPLEDTFDPRILLKPFDWHVYRLSEMTNIDDSFLFQRVFELMKCFKPFEEWNKEAENKQREIISAMQLGNSFSRPRTILAKKALYYLIAELFDAGKLSESDEDSILNLIPEEDHDILKFDYNIRPEQLQYVHDFPKYNEELEKWVDLKPEIPRHGLGNSSEWLNIAELTLWKSHLHSSFYESAICTEHGKMFSECSLNLSEYIEFDDHDNSSLFLRSEHYFSKDITSKWIAFNPSYAKQLGWNNSEENPFAWRLENEVIVKSYLWADGHPLYDNQHGVITSPVGSGWVVLIKEKALHQLVDLLSSKLSRKYALTKRCSHQKKKWKGTATEPDYVLLSWDAYT